MPAHLILLDLRQDLKTRARNNNNLTNKKVCEWNDLIDHASSCCSVNGWLMNEQWTKLWI
jgi:hypothetical protein